MVSGIARDPVAARRIDRERDFIIQIILDKKL
jgi:hypothetical protein